jgi:Flp pilus assembly protein TadG
VKFGKQRGATLVEYAFVLIVFLTLLFGIGGFGHALFVYHHLNHAAKEGTRYAAVRGSTCSGDSSCVASNSATGINGPTTIADVTAYVKSFTPQSIDSTQLTVTVCGVSDAATACTASTLNGPQNCTAVVNYPGCTVEVTVQYDYNFIFPFVHTNAVSMSSTSDMIIVH